MTRAWFAGELETVAMVWRIWRRDGVALGFVTHDRDLWLDGLLHRAAPGIVPSAIRRSAGLEPDSAEVAGVLAHDAIAAADLAAGRFDAARIAIGLVDWASGERVTLYAGTIGSVSVQGDRFEAAITSRKADLQRDRVPRTSPACRAVFCGPECGLSAQRFSARARIARCDPDRNTVTLAGLADAAPYAGGQLRWLDGPLAGLASGVALDAGVTLVLDRPLGAAVPAGTAVLLREGCDRTLATCARRFGNALNFRGEPVLPGNDFVARTPVPE